MTPESIVAAQAHGLSPDEVARILDGLKRRVHHFIDPTASVHPTARVWHYATILADVVLGEGVQVGSHAEIGRGTTVGRGTRIGAHVFLPPHSVVGEDCFIGPSVSCADDRFPYIHREFDPPYTAEPPRIGNGVTIGLGAVLLPGVTIGDGAVVGAGTVVTKDVPAGCLIRGEPGRIKTPQELSPDAKAWLEELVGPRLALPIPPPDIAHDVPNP
jgi:UDP-2-acetamido-3-amino-2,3-dideoxy-glucuronate N-acetyltransferase